LEKIKRERAEKREQEVRNFGVSVFAPKLTMMNRNERRLLLKRRTGSTILPAGIPC